MSALAGHVADYLRLRRALGFVLEREGQVLPQFVAHLEAAGSAHITSELAIEWARLSTNAQPITRAHRLGAVRAFARYLATIDPRTQVPPPPREVFAARQVRPAPYLYSQAEIARLLAGARQLRTACRAVTYETLFGLLAATGMRVGEALGLEREGLDLKRGVVHVRQAKRGRARLVALHPSVTEALGRYLAGRERRCPAGAAGSLFVSSRGSALTYSSVRTAFNQVAGAIGLRAARPRPRIHDYADLLVMPTLLRSFCSERFSGGNCRHNQSAARKARRASGGW